MIGLKYIYHSELNIDKGSLILRFKNSTDFLVENDFGYGGSAYTGSQLNKVFIRQADSEIFQLSENAGLGGMFEIIGTVNIEQIDKKKSLIGIKIQTGIFPLNTPQILILALLSVGLILLILTPAFLILSFLICLLLSLWWIANYIRVKIFLDIVSKAIQIENKWK